MAGTDVAPSSGKVLHVDGEGLVAKADAVELAHDLEGRVVGGEVELVRGVGAVKDEIEGVGVRLGPVVLVGVDELFCAQLKRVVLLGGRVREGVDFGPESLCPHDGEVTETTDSDNSDLLSWPGAETHQRGVCGQTGAQHRRGECGLNVIRNLEGEVLVRAHVAGVTTLSHGAVAVLCAIGVDGVGAVVLLVGLAVVAGQVGLDLRSHADAVADLDRLHVLADLDGFTDDFVTNAEGHGGLAPAAADGVNVRRADTTSVDGNVNVAVFEGLEGELEGRNVSGLEACTQGKWLFLTSSFLKFL